MIYVHTIYVKNNEIFQRKFEEEVIHYCSDIFTYKTHKLSSDDALKYPECPHYSTFSFEYAGEPFCLKIAFCDRLGITLNEFTLANGRVDKYFGRQNIKSFFRAALWTFGYGASKFGKSKPIVLFKCDDDGEEDAYLQTSSYSPEVSVKAIVPQTIGLDGTLGAFVNDLIKLHQDYEALKQKLSVTVNVLNDLFESLEVSRNNERTCDEIIKSQGVIIKKLQAEVNSQNNLIKKLHGEVNEAQVTITSAEELSKKQVEDILILKTEIESLTVSKDAVQQELTELKTAIQMVCKTSE